MWMTADQVARHGYRAVMHNKTVDVPGFANKFILTMTKYLPDDFAPVLKKSQSRLFHLLST